MDVGLDLLPVFDDFLEVEVLRRATLAIEQQAHAAGDLAAAVEVRQLPLQVAAYAPRLHTLLQVVAQHLQVRRQWRQLVE
ncbi:hypothetical protein D3C78_1529670 [compost metagenome]